VAGELDLALFLVPVATAGSRALSASSNAFPASAASSAALPECRRDVKFQLGPLRQCLRQLRELLQLLRRQFSRRG